MMSRVRHQLEPRAHSGDGTAQLTARARSTHSSPGAVVSHETTTDAACSYTGAGVVRVTARAEVLVWNFTLD